MVDYAKITIKAGNGGRGGISFGKFFRGHPGKPEGGDGGKGGDVYIEADQSKNTLSDYQFVKSYKAPNGENGNVNQRFGAIGDDLVLRVPVGTQVRDIDSGEVYDLLEPGKRIQLARGGAGGHGNMHLKSVHLDKRSNEYWELVHEPRPGKEGEEKELELELKLLADVGLLGLPNAGKSTLLSVLSAARPKIANYPFTTLEPYLGVMTYKGENLVIADLPGLIEGAHEGKGLGTQFLKHVERTKILVHLVSVENENPVESYRVINKELEGFSKDLVSKPQIAVLNKIDLITEKELETIIKQFKKIKVVPLCISAATSTGIEALQKRLLQDFKKLQKEETV